MKLIIQIPCDNETETLGIALSALPREVPGFDTVERLIIDDGSMDDTDKVALVHSVDHQVRHTRSHGLARGFMNGLQDCLARGAEVIVNTAADNQYNADDILLPTQPIVDGKADIIVGARPIQTIEHFSPVKNMLRRLGSWVVRVARKTDIPDAPSGFGAISRTAVQRMVICSGSTYTLETIIQTGQKNMAITSMPIRVNGDLRSSSLVKSMLSYITRSIGTIIRVLVINRPFRFFSTIGKGAGNIQPLILSSSLLIIGFHTFLIAFITDLLSANRRLLEEIRCLNLQARNESASQMTKEAA